MSVTSITKFNTIRADLFDWDGCLGETDWSRVAAVHRAFLNSCIGRSESGRPVLSLWSPVSGGVKHFRWVATRIMPDRPRYDVFWEVTPAQSDLVLQVFRDEPVVLETLRAELELDID